MSYAEVERHIPSRNLLFDKVPVYHKAKFWLGHKEVHCLQSDEYDVLHAHPSAKDADNNIIPGRFDTAMINTGDGEYVGIKGYQIGQVKVIFSLPKDIQLFAPNVYVPPYLAYVEWFTAFDSNADHDHHLYDVERAVDDNNNPYASVIPLDNISHSIHLFPEFDFPVSRDWSSETVLNDGNRFYVNSFANRHAFHTIL